MNDQPISVLLVDDDEDTQNLLHAVMEHYNYPLSVAADSQGAVDYLAQHSTDVILLDIFLPDRNGYDTLKIIRKNNPSNPPKIVAITAYYNDETPADMINRGFDGYLKKPLSPTELVPYLRDLMTA